VSGLVLPTNADNEFMALYEEFGGHSKGRGFIPAVFGQEYHRIQHPLFPLPPFGVGANMAFRREAIEACSGFDTALGAGTTSMAGEDTAAICDVMLAGGTIVYAPSAIARHSHRADWESLLRQMRGYGRGITAFYMRMVLKKPRNLATCLRLLPRGMMELAGKGAARTQTMTSQFPRALTYSEYLGMLEGPFAYLYTIFALTNVRRRQTSCPDILETFKTVNNRNE
jgi:cellulose synthase/poly-beta-1,6-N-acetylglucosamine synthase-like glycosyltransferase